MPVKRRNPKELKKLKNDLFNSNVQTMMRMKHKNSPSMTKEEQDLHVIDLTLKELYNDGDKTIIDFKKDVLEKYNLNHDQKTFDRYWDILDATNLVNPVVGFGNTNKLSLTSDGYNLMLKFGGYKNFVQAIVQGQAPPPPAPHNVDKMTDKTQAGENEKSAEPTE